MAISDTVAVVRERNRLRKLLDNYLHSGGFPETAFISDERVKKELKQKHMCQAPTLDKVANRFLIQFFE